MQRSRKRAGAGASDDIGEAMTPDSLFPAIATRPSRRIIIATLGVTQILAWGSTYYSPAVLARPIARDTGWPLSWVVGGLSLGLLIAALISPRVGASIERYGGRPVLAMSAVAIGIGQVGLAMAPNLATYIIAWLIVGVGMGAGLYDAAFGALGRLYGRDARAAITTLTLFGGLASTVCWPLSAFMVSEVGWRGACLVYAAIQFAVALPLYLLVIPRTAEAEGPHLHNKNTAHSPITAKPSVTLLVTLAVTLTLAAALSSLMSVHLLTILQSTGMTLAAAVGLGALVGPCQVAARTVEIAVARFHHPIWTKIASVSFVALGVSALWTGLPLIPLALAFYGAGIGLESIARGTLPLALFGPSGYATLMGRLAMPSLLAQAAAPWVGAMLLERIGAHGTLAVVASVAALNVALSICLGWAVYRHLSPARNVLT
jgi:MFS family permease